LRVGFQDTRVTSNGGLLLVRELDERLGFGELIHQHLTDCQANNARFSFADLLRQSVYSRLAGYEDVNDAERLSKDPALRLIGSEKIWDRWTAASVGIAQAAVKTIPLSPCNGELSEKAGSGCSGDGFSGPGKGRLGAGGTIWEKILCSEGSTGGKRVYIKEPSAGQKTHFGFIEFPPFPGLTSRR